MVRSEQINDNCYCKEKYEKILEFSLDKDCKLSDKLVLTIKVAAIEMKDDLCSTIGLESTTQYIFKHNKNKIISGHYRVNGIRHRREIIPKDEIVHVPLSSLFDFSNTNDIYNIKDINVPVDCDLTIRKDVITEIKEIYN